MASSESSQLPTLKQVIAQQTDPALYNPANQLSLPPLPLLSPRGFLKEEEEEEEEEEEDRPIQILHEDPEAHPNKQLLPRISKNKLNKTILHTILKIRVIDPKSLEKDNSELDDDPNILNNELERSAATYRRPRVDSSFSQSSPIGQFIQSQSNLTIVQTTEDPVPANPRTADIERARRRRIRINSTRVTTESTPSNNPQIKRRLSRRRNTTTTKKELIPITTTTFRITTSRGSTLPDSTTDFPRGFFITKSSDETLVTRVDNPVFTDVPVTESNFYSSPEKINSSFGKIVSDFNSEKGNSDSVKVSSNLDYGITSNSDDTTSSSNKAGSSFEKMISSSDEMASGYYENTYSFEKAISNPDEINSNLEEATSSFRKESSSSGKIDPSFKETTSSSEKIDPSFEEATSRSDNINSSFEETNRSPDKINLNFEDVTSSPDEINSTFEETTSNPEKINSNFEDATSSPHELNSTFEETTSEEIIFSTTTGANFQTLDSKQENKDVFVKTPEISQGNEKISEEGYSDDYSSSVKTTTEVFESELTTFDEVNTPTIVTQKVPRRQLRKKIKKIKPSVREDNSHKKRIRIKKIRSSTEAPEPALTSDDPKMISDTLKMIPHNPESISDNPELVPDNPELIPHNPELIPDNRELSSKSPKFSSRNLEISSDNLESISTNPESTSRNSEFTSRNKEFTSKNSELISDNPEIISKSSAFSSNKPQFISQNSGFIAKNLELLSRYPELISYNSESNFRNPVLNSDNSEFTADKPEFVSGNSDNSYFNPKVVSKNPDYFDNSEFISKNPVYIPDNPEFISRNPEFDAKNPELTSRDSEFASRDSEFVSRNSAFTSRNPEDSKNSEFTSRNTEFISRDPKFTSKKPEVSKHSEFTSRKSETSQNPEYILKNPEFDAKNQVFTVTPSILMNDESGKINSDTSVVNYETTTILDSTTDPTLITTSFTNLAVTDSISESVLPTSLKDEVLKDPLLKDLGTVQILPEDLNIRYETGFDTITNDASPKNDTFKQFGTEASFSVNDFLENRKQSEFGKDEMEFEDSRNIQESTRKKENTTIQDQFLNVRTTLFSANPNQKEAVATSTESILLSAGRINTNPLIDNQPLSTEESLNSTKKTTGETISKDPLNGRRRVLKRKRIGEKAEERKVVKSSEPSLKNSEKNLRTSEKSEISPKESENKSTESFSSKTISSANAPATEKPNRIRVVIYRGAKRFSTVTTPSTTTVQSLSVTGDHQNQIASRRRLRKVVRKKPKVPADDTLESELDDQSNRKARNLSLNPEMKQIEDAEEAGSEVNTYRTSPDTLRRPGSSRRELSRGRSRTTSHQPLASIHPTLRRFTTPGRQTIQFEETTLPPKLSFDSVDDAAVLLEHLARLEDQKAEIDDQTNRAHDLVLDDSETTTESGVSSIGTTFWRKISTTELPKTLGTTAAIPALRRRQGQKYFNKIITQNLTQRPRRPAIIDYDYYEDEEIRLVGKPRLNGKLYVTSRGNINCLDQGNFPHPISCKKFITCARMVNGLVVGTEYTCPDKLSFDPIGGICNWSAGLGCKE